MPYTVNDDSGDRAERVYCRTAAKALAQHKIWSDAGRTQVHIVSVEGAEVSVERLAKIATSEAAINVARRTRFG